MRVGITVDVVARRRVSRIVDIADGFDHDLIVGRQFSVDIAANVREASSTIASDHAESILSIVNDAHGGLGEDDA